MAIIRDPFHDEVARPAVKGRGTVHIKARSGVPHIILPFSKAGNNLIGIHTDEGFQQEIAVKRNPY